MNVLSLHMNAMPQQALGREWVKLCGWSALPPLAPKADEPPRLEMRQDESAGGHRELVERIRREVRCFTIIHRMCYWATIVLYMSTFSQALLS